MTQRVNIQYSVKIDDIEGEVARLYKKSNDLLKQIALTAETPPETFLSIENHEEIDKIRLKLTDIDATLADISLIIGSYISYKSQEMLQTVAKPPDPTQQSQEGNYFGHDELVGLQEKIANFKNKLGETESSGENDADIG